MSRSYKDGRNGGAHKFEGKNAAELNSRRLRGWEAASQYNKKLTLRLERRENKRLAKEEE